MQWINNQIQQRQPWKISIAEDMKDNEWLTKSASDQGAGFTSQWGASFVSTIRNAIIDSDDRDRDMLSVASVISQRYNGNALQRVIFTESHDADSNGAQRVPEMIWPGKADSWYSKKRSTLGAAIVMAAPGIPMIFMGQEFAQLLAGLILNTELDWSLAAKFKGISLLYQDLIRLRRNWFDNTRGLRGQNVNVFHVNNADKVIGLHRWDSGGASDDVVIVLNFADQLYSSYSLGFPRAGRWRVRFDSDWNGYDASFNNCLSYDTETASLGMDGTPVSANVGIGAYTAIILSQDRNRLAESGCEGP